jgi:hypothetical protein
MRGTESDENEMYELMGLQCILTERRARIWVLLSREACIVG